MNRIVLMVLRNFWRVPGLWIKLCRYARHPERYSWDEMWKHIQHIMNVAIKAGNIELQVYGTENIPQEDGFLLYGNHQGMFDIMAIASSSDTPMGAVLKKELADVPFLKQVIACTGSFAMDRENLKQSMEVILKVIKEVKKGRNYLIFPEGTRSRNGNHMVEFHGGSFKCALKTNAPIVPIAFVDSFKVLDQKGCRPVTVQIHYLKPIYAEEYKGMNTIELAALVKTRIQDVLDHYVVYEE